MTARAKSPRSDATARILLAGVGNIFLTDDAFGCEVVRALSGLELPDGVEVVDFGIRGVHLAYQLLDGYDVLVLIDAAPRGREPGSVSLLEVDLAEVAANGQPATDAVSAGGAPLLDVHGLAPGTILTMLSSLGGTVGRVLVVACEPGSVQEGIGLSDPVRAAIPQAVALLERLINDLAAQEGVTSRCAD